MINLDRALRYPFSGRDAFGKTLIGALMILLLPVFFITGLVLLGYQLRIIRDVLHDHDEGLPEWNDLAGDVVQGLVVLVGSLLYYLPSMLLVGLGAAMAWDMFSGLGTLIDPFRHDTLEIDRVELSMMCVYFALAAIWLLISAPLIMAATAKYADTGKFSAFTHILDLADEVWEQRGAAARLSLNLFMLAVIAQLANAVASVTCLASAYVQFIQFAAICHLAGQWGLVLQTHRPRPNVIRPLKPRY